MPPKPDNEHPAVSVIVPVRNCARTIRELLESLTKINYSKDKLEVVIVDGNSTDGTREIASQYPVKVLTQDGVGINGGRNTGLKHSKGEIVAFTDGDCVVPRDWIQKIVADFQDADVGCVGGSILGCEGSFISRYADKSVMPMLRRFRKREVLNSVKPPLKYPAGCNMAIRRTALQQAGMFNENIMLGFDEDELVERICQSGKKMVLDPEVLVRHKHRSSLKELLKQNFRYGRGMGMLSQIKGATSKFSRWMHGCIAGFVATMSTVLGLLALTVFCEPSVFSILFLAVLLFPAVSLMTFYARQAVKDGDREYLRMLTYPFVDMMRAFAFVCGAIYQLLRHSPPESRA